MVKNPGKSWKVIALSTVAAIVSLCFVAQSRAFTLIETQFLPAIQLVASQAAQVKVSNVSTDPVDVSVAIIGHNGNVLVSQTVSLAAGHTFSLPYIKPAATAASDIRAVVSLGAASATVSSLMTFDKTTGEVIAILPGILAP